MDRFKFETCKFRSENEEKSFQISCCYTIEVHGYICKAKSIYKLNPEICVNCDVYSSKETGSSRETQSS